MTLSGCLLVSGVPMARDRGQTHDLGCGWPQRLPLPDHLLPQHGLVRVPHHPIQLQGQDRQLSPRHPDQAEVRRVQTVHQRREDEDCRGQDVCRFEA